MILSTFQKLIKANRYGVKMKAVKIKKHTFPVRNVTFICAYVLWTTEIVLRTFIRLRKIVPNHANLCYFNTSFTIQTNKNANLN